MVNIETPKNENQEEKKITSILKNKLPLLYLIGVVWVGYYGQHWKFVTLEIFYVLNLVIVVHPEVVGLDALIERPNGNLKSSWKNLLNKMSIKIEKLSEHMNTI